MKTKTQDEFIFEAIQVHGDRFDYSLVEYKKSVDKIIIICKKHSNFNQTPKDHLKGTGCKKCATEIVHNKQRSNTEEFITPFYTSNADFLIF
jgi:hypothetical protein